MTSLERLRKSKDRKAVEIIKEACHIRVQTLIQTPTISTKITVIPIRLFDAKLAPNTNVRYASQANSVDPEDHTIL